MMGRDVGDDPLLVHDIAKESAGPIPILGMMTSVDASIRTADTIPSIIPLMRMEQADCFSNKTHTIKNGP